MSRDAVSRREISRAASGGQVHRRSCDAELLQAGAERARLQSEDLGRVAGSGDPPMAAFEHAQEVRALYIVEAVARLCALRAPREGGVEPEHGAGAQDERALDHAGGLAHVAPPRVAGKELALALRHAPDPA